MRVFAVAHVLFLFERESELVGEFYSQTALHIVGDHSVVYARVAEHLIRETEAEVRVRRIARYALDDLVVIGGIDNHYDAGIVLRRASYHGRAADVDVLHRFGERHARFLYRGFERIEVDRDDVYFFDAQLFQLLHVLGQVAAGEQTGVHRGVQRLYPAVEALGKAGYVADVYRFPPRFSEFLFRAARRDDLEAEFGKSAGEIDDARLVADAYERSSLSHKYISV